MRARLLIIAALTILNAPASAEPVRIVASFSILADLARQVGGDRVGVVSLVGPEGDAHGFEAKPSDARVLASAELLLVNGLGFDPWADRLARAANFHGVRIAAASAVHPIGAAERPDPHAWQSVPNAIAYVDAIVAGLTRARPAEAAAFRDSGEAFKTRLRALDADIRSQFASFLPARRHVLTPHRAFAYYGQEYGISFESPAGTDADAEAPGRVVADLIGEIRAGKIQAVFAEHPGGRRSAERIAAEAHIPMGGELYSDALSRPGGPAATYEAMMRANTEIIVSALSADRVARPAP